MRSRTQGRTSMSSSYQQEFNSHPRCCNPDERATFRFKWTHHQTEVCCQRSEIGELLRRNRAQDSTDWIQNASILTEEHDEKDVVPSASNTIDNQHPPGR